VSEAGGIVRIFSWSFYYIIPNLENFNLSQPVGYGGGASAAYMIRITAYAALFSIILLTIGYLVFRRKDL